MDFAVCKVPVAPVRKKASHQSEMVNQLLYGEAVRIGKAYGKWLLVEGCMDGYTGWVTASHLTLHETLPAQYDAFVTADPVTHVITRDGFTILLPMGSFLQGYQPEHGYFDTGRGVSSGKVLERAKQSFDKMLLLRTTLSLLHAPYLWGGKTVMGMDCSGFVQTVFRLMHIDLPRDARQQVMVGDPLSSVSETEPGDLAFFEDKGEIVHVGIVYPGGSVIHASGEVRVDSLQSEGIVDSKTGLCTHRLCLLKRVRRSGSV